MADIDIYEVTKKLAGPINPAGESHTDSERLENLSSIIYVVDRLLSDIQRVANRKDAHQDSIKTAGNRASSFLENVGLEIQESNNF